MISPQMSNRLIFIFSLLGLTISAFLLYEYSLSGPVICPVGQGCNIVRASSYSHFLGISIPILGLAFYLGMAILSIIRPQKLNNKTLLKLQLLGAISGVGFGSYLTYLEAFVIKAFCFWCVLSFIISLMILAAVLVEKKTYDDRN